MESISITTGYSNKAEIYDTYRWRYSEKSIQKLIKTLHIGKSSIIADIGSGTGILSEYFIDNCKHLYMVEPNEEMRRIAEHKFNNKENGISIEGLSSNTTINDDNIDFIIAGHAVNWFDLETTRREFQRILRKNGWIIFVHNRIIGSNAAKYLNELNTKQYGYHPISSNIHTGQETDYFEEETCEEIRETFTEFQDVDHFVGSLESASFYPSKNHAYFEKFREKALEIFERSSENGFIKNEIETIIQFGKLTREG